MSNKLTREVKYLNKSDRPKKVEPLSFNQWSREAKDTHILHSTLSKIDELATEYATYLQEFSAEEVGVEFVKFLSGASGLTLSHRTPSEFDSIVYLGRDASIGDMFSVTAKDYILIYSGKLNNGHY